MRNLRGKIETASFDGANNFFFNICIQNYDKFGIWEGQMFLRYKRKNISFTIQLLRQKWKKKKVLNSGILIVPRRDLDFQRMQTSRTVTSHVAF